ncbi:MAG: ROK family protein [Thaumarchaeota archaeon]|nr:ROK family protein [Nitrososphaerota archaeon]
MAGELVIGIDLGATNVRAAIGSLGSGIIKKVKRRTIRESDRNAVVRQLEELVREVAGENLKKVQAIGIGSIGPIDLKKGVILNPPNAPFRDVPIVKALSETFGAPVYLLNDCNTAVLGEKVFGIGRNSENIFYLTLSSGIGGGAIVDGNLLMGKDGNAVEIGHISVSYEFELVCTCGSMGHWEAYCSGRNIPNFVKAFIEKHSEEFENSVVERLVSENKLTPESLFDLAKKGDRRALRIVEEIGKINAVGFADINNLYDPELITVGGAIALNNWELILDSVLKHIKEYTVNRVPRIEITPLGDDVVLYGAIALAANPPSKLVR